jgi:hypothetical protein
MSEDTPMEKNSGNSSLKMLSAFCLVACLLSILLAVVLYSWGPELAARNLSGIEDPAFRAGMIAAHKER